MDIPQPGQFEGLIFDCDGTLADTMPAHYLAWLKISQQWGIDFSEDAFYKHAGTPSATILEHLAREQNVLLDVVQVAQQKEAAFLEHIDEIQPIECVTAIAREHRGQRPVAVATGAVRNVLARILAKIDMTGCFDAEVTAEDTERHKPEPDVFLEAARRINVPPSRCLVYEDADGGVEAARRAGMEVVDVRIWQTPRRIT